MYHLSLLVLLTASAPTFVVLASSAGFASCLKRSLHSPIGECAALHLKDEDISASSDADEVVLMQKDIQKTADGDTLVIQRSILLKKTPQADGAKDENPLLPSRTNLNLMQAMSAVRAQKWFDVERRALYLKLGPLLQEYFVAPPATGAAEGGLDEWDSLDTLQITVMLVVLVLFDILVVPKSHYKLSNHVMALAFMVIASGVFCAFVWRARGRDDGVAWATGYALEWALSMDNLFVFHLVFKAFSVPAKQAMKALRIGIYGAVLFRMVFILFLTQLLSLSYWMEVAIGICLIISGFVAVSSDDDEDVQNLATVRFFKWLLGPRLLDSYSEDGSIVVKSDDGGYRLTVLFLVVCVVAVIDCVFAVDSVGSKTGQIKSVYINLTSSLMGMFSLRSLFFIVRDMAEYFDYVKYGIAGILCFVGVDMIISKWFAVPLQWMCAIICILFTSSIAASVIKVYASIEVNKVDEKGVKMAKATA